MYNRGQVLVLAPSMWSVRPFDTQFGNIYSVNHERPRKTLSAVTWVLPFKVFTNESIYTWCELIIPVSTLVEGIVAVNLMQNIFVK